MRIFRDGAADVENAGEDEGDEGAEAEGDEEFVGLHADFPFIMRWSFFRAEGVGDGVGKIPNALVDAVELQDGAGIVGHFHDGKMAGEIKALVHIESGDELLGEDVAAAVAADDDSEEGFVGKLALAIERGETIDEGCEIGGDGVVVIGADHDNGVGTFHSGINVFDHDAAVKTAFLLAKMETGFIRTAGAILHGAVAQAELLNGKAGKLARNGVPERESVRGFVVGGVQHGEFWHGAAIAFKRHDSAHEGAGAVDISEHEIVGAELVRGDGEIAQTSGTLDEGASDKGAAAHIGGENELLGGRFCVKLALGVDDDAAEPALQQMRMGAQHAQQAAVFEIDAVAVELDDEEHSRKMLPRCD